MRPASARWHGLLVSVRDAAEAVEAVAGGAAIVDVKEPAHGPLGAAPAATAAAVAGVVAGRVPWTLACGELVVGRAAAHVADAIAALPQGAVRPVAAKAGPAGLTSASWRREFAAFAAALPHDVAPVAVAYADWHAAGAPPPADVVAAAAALGCGTLLIDTFDKEGPGILADCGTSLPPQDAATADPGNPRRCLRSARSTKAMEDFVHGQLGPATGAPLPRWIAAARRAGMTVAVAGRIALADLGRVADLGGDVVAVRSAACHGGRMGRVDRALVAAAAGLVSAAAAGRPCPATLGGSAAVPPPPSPGDRIVKPLEVRVPHHLDNADVRRRIDRALEKARDEYAAQVGPIDAAWRDDGRLHVKFTVMGAAIDSEVELAEKEAIVRVTLPGFAGMFAGQVRTGIAERLGGLLGPPAA